LVERVSGERLDEYSERYIFQPLKMEETRYLAMDDGCGNAELLNPKLYQIPGTIITNLECIRPPGFLWGWDASQWLRNTAPTQHDDQGTAATNPDFDRQLRGTVHDPTARRMGGVAGEAGVFSTADDMAKFAQALLDKLLRNAGSFPLKQSTLRMMTRPEQPATALGGATIFKQDGTTTTGVAQRGFGWDLNSAFSRPRGSVFPTVMTADAKVQPSFGHTGFTGTSLWIDPASDTYVVLLANSVHPRGAATISPLRGEVATQVGKALGLNGGKPTHDDKGAIKGAPGSMRVKVGINVLEEDGFTELKEMAKQHGGHLRLGLLTNQTGVDAAGRRTIDILRGAGDGIELVRLFSPEHGLFGAKDSMEIGREVDAASGLPVVSLYGPKDADKRPKAEDLKDLDAVVVDLQDAGVRFYTYETVVGYFVDTAACQMEPAPSLVILDRPPLLGGDAMQGPVSDPRPSYVNYYPIPLRHGMTLGELALFFRRDPQACSPYVEHPHSADVHVVKMEGWHRWEFFDTTGVKWVNPSPNLRSVEEATLYPGMGMLDYANVSVGRGTATPFEVFGAAWMDGRAVADYLSGRRIAGVRFEATKFAVAETAEKYPGHGQTIDGVKMTVTDRVALDSPEMGVEILAALHHLYPKEFQLEKATGLVANSETMDGLRRGDDPRTIAAGWEVGLKEFELKRAGYLLYR
jgi:uncharacterized protein YbbC (DUF1343 family)/CubicO group peptidase (beta-lactamase class C family)